MFDEQPRFSRGTIIGRYVIAELLGSGAMGQVYEAYDPELDRTIALKVIRAETGGAAPEVLQAALLREALALAKLAHPNVVTVHDAGVHEGQVFFAMEYIRGLTLGAWSVPRSGRWREVLRVLIDAGRGLAAAHAIGLVHRDFKPGNVLVSEAGRVFVLDFGLVQGGEYSRAIAKGHGPDGGEMGETVFSRAGTPAYMSPEQHRGAVVDSRSDQFSFCVTAYQLLCGVRPFQGTAEEILEQIDAQKIQPRTNHRVPKRVVDLLVRGMSPVPDARYARMDELLRELERALLVRRRVQATLAVVGLVGAVVGVTTTRHVPSCDGSDNTWAQVWNPTQSTELRLRLAEFSSPSELDHGGAVISAIEEYGHQWRQMTENACVDTHVRGLQSVHLMDLQMACLNRRLSEMRALLGGFAEIDEHTARNALIAVHSLTPLQRCRDASSLLEGEREPEPRIAGAVQALRVQLDRARASFLTGHYRAASDAVVPLAAKARELGYPPVLAEVLQLHSEVQQSLGEFDASRLSLFNALLEAERSDYDVLAWEASSRLVFINFQRADYDEAELWRDHTLALLDRNDAEPRARGIAKLHAMSLAFGRGELSAAAALLDEAIAYLESDENPMSKELATCYANLGVVYDLQGRWRESIDATETALGFRVELFGSRHPETGVTLLNLASAYAAVGRVGLADQLAQRSLEIWAEVDPHAYFTNVVRLTIAALAQDRGWLADAEERAQAVIEEIGGTGVSDNYNLIPAWQVLGLTQLARGKLDEGEAALGNALRLVEAAPNATPHEQQLAIRLAVTEIDWAHRRVDAVYRARSELRTEARHRFGKDDPRLADFEIKLGEAAYRTSRLEEAQSRLADGVSLLAVDGDVPKTVYPLALRAVVLRELGRQDAAREVVERLDLALDGEEHGDDVLAVVAYAKAVIWQGVDTAQRNRFVVEAAGAFARSETRDSWIEERFRRWLAGESTSGPAR